MDAATTDTLNQATPLRLLIVDDSDDDAALIVETLHEAGYKVAHRRVAKPEAFRAALQEHWDVVTCDHAMPGFDAPAAYAILAELRPEVPFVIVSGNIGERGAVRVMSAGASDYVDKANLERLVPVVARELRNRHRLESMANLDPVTGVGNRNVICHRLSRQIESQREVAGQTPAHLLLVGLDRFKKINDVFGHDAGDGVLRETARRLTEVFGWDAVGRVGDDEFMVLAAGETVERPVSDVQRSLATPFRVRSREVYITASIGSAPVAAGGDACDLFNRVESAMRVAKRAGRNRHRTAAAVAAAPAADTINLEHDLRHALERQQLRVFYQVQVDARNRRPIGHEALVRWRHPQLGTISPADFIPIAEESGEVVPIGSWVLAETCRLAAAGRLKKVAVNISARQFHESDLVREVQSVLETTGLAPARLELEITESTLISDTEAAVATLKAIKGLGVHVAIDDFGTGYCSLGYLQRFPLDTLKVDRCFIADLERDARSLAITESLIALGHRLGLAVIAEGVESESQADRLRDMGCDRLQGFLYGRPEPLSE